MQLFFCRRNRSWHPPWRVSFRLPQLPSTGGTGTLAGRTDAEKLQIVADIGVAPGGNHLAETVNDTDINVFHPSTSPADDVVMVSLTNVLVTRFVVAKVAAPHKLEPLEDGNASVNGHTIAPLSMESPADLVNRKWPVVTDQEVEHQLSWTRHPQPAAAQRRQGGLANPGRVRLAVLDHKSFLYATDLPQAILTCRGQCPNFRIGGSRCYPDTRVGAARPPGKSGLSGSLAFQIRTRPSGSSASISILAPEQHSQSARNQC